MNHIHAFQVAAPKNSSLFEHASTDQSILIYKEVKKKTHVIMKTSFSNLHAHPCFGTLNYI